MVKGTEAIVAASILTGGILLTLTGVNQLFNYTGNREVDSVIDFGEAVSGIVLSVAGGFMLAEAIF